MLLRIVLDSNGNLMARLQVHANLIVRSQPPLSPVIHHQLPVEPDLDAAIGVRLKLVVAGDRRKNVAGPGLPIRARAERFIGIATVAVQR
jgi:hypothetical protein